jgi:ergothioneine biosynthesis protein EgtB
MSYLNTHFPEKENTIRPENKQYLDTFIAIRKQTEEICKPLAVEDYVVQPIADVSPPKWHLGHTTWFFETMILVPYFQNYTVFDKNYNYIFNSYYESIGARVIRTDRGNLSRPSVENIYNYRKHVTNAIIDFLKTDIQPHVFTIFELGMQHEQQHQELLITDIKYILGNNPLFPAYEESALIEKKTVPNSKWISVEEGVYEIGFDGTDFCFDNELNRHKVYLHSYQIASELVTNREFLDFMNSGGYHSFRHWHADGWNWVEQNQAKAPMYWYFIDSQWYTYTLNGLRLVEWDEPVCHINFYEAFAFASWSEKRLPTEAEWEVANSYFNWGTRWEWTQSAYLPYPGFTTAEDATGEYNGKFMVNQMVLRGASVATAKNHSRATYRNFFQTNLQLQFTGIRLAQ